MTIANDKHERVTNRCPWAAAFMVVSLLALGCNSGELDAASDSSADAPPPAVVKTAPVIERDLAAEVSLVGTVTAIRRSVVGSPVDGRVTKIDVSDGDPVEMLVADGAEQGQVLAQLSTEPIAIDIAAAKAELVRLKEELAELRAGSRPEEIAQAKAQWEAAKAVNEYASARIKRAQQLIDRKALSTDDFETAESAALAALQNVAAAEAGYEMAKAGPRQEKIAQAVARVEQQQQEVARLETQLRYHTIRAPFSGYVVEKHTEVGQWLTRGAAVAEIVELDPIEVVFHVPESLVAQLEVGQSTPVAFDAFPKQEPVEGVIRGISPSANQARTFPVHIRVANPKRDGRPLLREGMQARAMLEGDKRLSLLVPKDALILGGPRPVVMIANTNADGVGVALQVEVEAGLAQDDLIQVQGELEVGQHVIVSGNERVRPGQTIRVAK